MDSAGKRERGVRADLRIAGLRIDLQARAAGLADLSELRASGRCFEGRAREDSLLAVGPEGRQLNLDPHRSQIAVEGRVGGGGRCRHRVLAHVAGRLRDSSGEVVLLALRLCEPDAHAHRRRHGEQRQERCQQKDAGGNRAPHHASSPSNRYPAPQTVTMYLGSEGISSIFSRRRRM